MPTKDPAEVLDYPIDWDRSVGPDGVTPGPPGTGWLSAGETISTSTWSIETKVGDTSPLVQAPTAPSKTSTTTTIWLQGGSVPNRYEVTNHITTSQGRTTEQSFSIKIREK